MSAKKLKNNFGKIRRKNLKGKIPENPRFSISFSSIEYDNFIWHRISKTIYEHRKSMEEFIIYVVYHDLWSWFLSPFRKEFFPHSFKVNKSERKRRKEKREGKRRKKKKEGKRRKEKREGKRRKKKREGKRRKEKREGKKMKKMWGLMINFLFFKAQLTSYFLLVPNPSLFLSSFFLSFLSFSSLSPTPKSCVDFVLLWFCNFFYRNKIFFFLLLKEKRKKMKERQK